MIVVTGGAGFIGSNLVRGLNAAGESDIVVVDDVTAAGRLQNLKDARIADYVDKEVFRERLRRGGAAAGEISVLFHQGACTDTMERNRRFMLENNYAYSRDLLDWCLQRGVRLIYASSAAVYGTGSTFLERPEFEAPVNVYGYSKKLFDDYVRQKLSSAKSQIAGLRYFNVYGPREAHKRRMASVAYHLNEQIRNGESLKLFKGSGGYADGQQRRDFVYVQDAVDVNLWFMAHPEASGIYNVGTGGGRSFLELAALIRKWHGRGRIEYIDFPPGLISGYQHFTQADVGRLRSTGYAAAFTPLERGIPLYLEWLNQDAPVAASRISG